MKKLNFLIFPFLILLLGFEASARRPVNPNVKLKKYLKMRRAKALKKAKFQITPIVGINAMGFQEPTIDFQGADSIYTAQPQIQSAMGILFDFHTAFRGVTLQTGLAYQPLRASMEEEVGNQKNFAEYQFGFLNIPFAAKIFPFTRAGRWFFVKAGTSFNALTDQRLNTRTVSVQGPTANTTVKKLEKNDFSNFDVQGIVGTGVSLVINPRVSILIEANYHHGFINLLKNQNVSESKFQTQGVSSYLGLSFNL